MAKRPARPSKPTRRAKRKTASASTSRRRTARAARPAAAKTSRPRRDAAARSQNAPQPKRPADVPRRDGVQHVPSNFHALYDRGFRSSRGLPMPAEPAPARRARVGRRPSDLEVHYDPATQLPNMIVATKPGATLPAGRRMAARARAAAPATAE